MRLDTPQTSIITLPGSQKTIMLDHLKKEAMVIPMQPASAAPSAPGMPKMPGAPKMPALQVQDLGKSMIEGHEVEGKRFTFSPPRDAAEPSGTAGPTGAANAKAPATSQRREDAAITEDAADAEAAAVTKAATAHGDRGLDQRKTKDPGADKSHNRRGRANHLLQAHIDSGTPSLDVRDSSGI